MNKHLENKFKAFDSIEIFYTKDIVENPKGIVVIVHGLCEHLGRYNYFTKKLNEEGFIVYRFDNRGHGKSGGERGYVEKFNDFLEDANKMVHIAKSEYKELPIFMFGHSMGGFITAAYGMKYKNELNGQLLSGAATIELPIFRQIKEGNYFEKNPRQKAPNNLSNLISRDKKIVKQYDEDPLVLKESNLKLLGECFIKGSKWISENVNNYEYPCLIMHGESDQIVIPEASKWFFKNIKSRDKELKIYPNCYHEILNEKDEKDEIIKHICSWIKKRI